MSKHTPTPLVRFKVLDDGRPYSPHTTFRVFAGPGGSGGSCGVLTMRDEEFVYLKRCVNAHDDLVAALNYLLDVTDDRMDVAPRDLAAARKEARAALKLVEGER